MDPKDKGLEGSGHDAPRPGPGPTPGASGDTRPPLPRREPSVPGPARSIPAEPAGGRAGGPSASGRGPAPTRTVPLVTGDLLLTVNPVDGSEVEPCPPGRRPARPARRRPAERAAAAGAGGGAVLPLLEREEERERLRRLLTRGRSARVTGPSGAGRTALLDVLAADCDGLAPDGVIRLSGYRRAPADLLHELYAAVFPASRYRPDRAELLAAVRGIGAVVVLDDIEFGGTALDDFLDATPECAFLISATREVPAPSIDSHVEEVFLSGLSRTACRELLEHAVGRPLTREEADWASDLWFESEGLPLRFVQAGALLRQRDARRARPGAAAGGGAGAEGVRTGASGP
ncbi:ATP-binding protein, partial [Streptomyces sp. B1866]|nr:ATP-binding protein [Streptomyces sp. B1866]